MRGPAAAGVPRPAGSFAQTRSASAANARPASLSGAAAAIGVAGVAGQCGCRAAAAPRRGTRCPAAAPPPSRRRGRRSRCGGRNWGSRRSSCSRRGRAPARACARTCARRGARRPAPRPAASRRSRHPASATRCAMVSCASPVPGGMSTTMMSSGPHSTWPIICSSAPITIGPRQIIGVSSSTRKPIDIAFSPQAGSGSMRVAAHLRLAREAQHARQAGAVDVGVQQADAQPLLRQRHGEVDRDRRLADAALAGGDRDDRADLGQQRRAGGVLAVRVRVAVLRAGGCWAAAAACARSARRWRSARPARAPAASPPRGAPAPCVGARCGR